MANSGPRPVLEFLSVNEVARKIMEDEGIVINDLFAFAKTQLAKIQKPQDVHFTSPGSQALAQQVGKAIETSLNSRLREGNEDPSR